MHAVEKCKIFDNCKTFSVIRTHTLKISSVCLGYAGLCNFLALAICLSG